MGEWADQEQDHQPPPFTCTCIVLHDDKNGAILSTVVPSKGEDEFAIQWVVHACDWLGYKRFKVRPDQESGLIKVFRLAEESCALRLAGTL